MDVSVIIVSYNAKKHLISCLRSLQNHQNKFIKEVVVVDNDSSDGSPEAVEKQFPDIKIVHNKKNLGFAKANNVGIKRSSGRYIVLINSDIVVLNNCLRELITFMDRNPATGIAGPRILNPDGSLQASCRHFPSIWNNFCQVIGLSRLFPKSKFLCEGIMKYWGHNETRDVDSLSGCFWIVRREALEEVGLLDEDFFIYGEDLDWCRRFHKAGWDVVFYPEAEAIHFGGASSSNSPIRFNVEMQKADMQYWRKHHGKSGELIYWMIIFVRQLVRMPVFALMYVFRARNRDRARFKLKGAFACIGFLFGFNIDK